MFSLNIQTRSFSGHQQMIWTEIQGLYVKNKGRARLYSQSRATGAACTVIPFKNKVMTNWFIFQPAFWSIFSECHNLVIQNGQNIWKSFLKIFVQLINGIKKKLHNFHLKYTLFIKHLEVKTFTSFHCAHKGCWQLGRIFAVILNALDGVTGAGP